MASRKEQKEQARATRLAQQEATAAKAQRTRRIQIFGGAIAIAVIVIVVAIVVSSSSGGTKSPFNRADARAAVRSVNAELASIPQSGTTLGNPKAKVTLTYFGDLQCPVCQAFTLGQAGGGLPQFIAQQVRPGHAKLVYRSFCTASCGNTSFSNPQAVFNKQQEAAYAAGNQNRFWNYAELFYHLQGAEKTPYVTEKYLTGLAGLAGVKVAAWQAARRNPVYAAQVASDNSLATKYGVGGTPALIIQGPKGIQSVGSGIIPYSQLAAAVKAVS